MSKKPQGAFKVLTIMVKDLREKGISPEDVEIILEGVVSKTKVDFARMRAVGRSTDISFSVRGTKEKITRTVESIYHLLTGEKITFEPDTFFSEESRYKVIFRFEDDSSIDIVFSYSDGWLCIDQQAGVTATP